MGPWAPEAWAQTKTKKRHYGKKTTNKDITKISKGTPSFLNDKLFYVRDTQNLEHEKSFAKQSEIA